MNKFHLLTLFCLLASIAIGTNGFIQRGKTSPRRAQETISQSTQEDQEDASDSNIKGVERQSDESGSLAGSVAEDSASSSTDEADEGHPAPEPYSFSYSADTDDGSSSTREETGDKDGTVTGFYMMMTADGSQRKVNYVADKTGFHATIQTNEIGTESKNPADVTIESSAPETVYPEAPSGNSVSTNSGSRSTANRQTNVVKTESADESDDDFGSDQSGSRSAPVARKQQPSDSQQEDTEEEAQPAPAPAPRPAPRPVEPTKTAPRPVQPRPAPRPAPRPTQPTKTAPRPVQPRPAPRPAPRPTQPTKTAPRPSPPRQAPTKVGSKATPVIPRRPQAPAPAPVKTSQETNVDEEEDSSFGSDGNEQAESTNAQYMVFPLNGVNRPEIANLINNRRPIVAANRDTGLWLNENQLRNLLAVSRYRS